MVSVQRREQGDARKDAIIVFIHSYRQVPPQRSPSMEKIAAGAFVTIDGQRQPLRHRSEVDYHLRRMRPDYPAADHVPAEYRGLVTWIPGEHNSLRLTTKGTKYAGQLLAADAAGFRDVVAAAQQAARPAGGPSTNPSQASVPQEIPFAERRGRP